MKFMVNVHFYFQPFYPSASNLIAIAYEFVYDVFGGLTCRIHPLPCTNDRQTTPLHQRTPFKKEEHGSYKETKPRL